MQMVLSSPDPGVDLQIVLCEVKYMRYPLIKS